MPKKKPKFDYSAYNPAKGIPYTLLNMFFLVLTRTCSKIIFERYPDMSTFQFLFIRGTVGFLVQLVMINRNLKKVVWDTVTKENRFNLTAKVVQGFLGVFT